MQVFFFALSIRGAVDAVGAVIVIVRREVGVHGPPAQEVVAQVHNIAREPSLYPLFAEVPAMLLLKKQGTATHTVAALIVRGTGMLGARARDVECPNKRAQCVSLGIQVVEEQHVRANEVRREVVIQGCKLKKKR